MNELLFTGSKSKVGVIHVPLLKLNVATRKEYKVQVPYIRLLVAKQRFMGEPE